MNDGTQPLGPILVFSKKDNAFAARLPPLGEQMESHHAQGAKKRSQSAAYRSFVSLRGWWRASYWNDPR